jgi:hypothetical protein
MVLDPIQFWKNYFANLNYKFNDKTSIHFDYTFIILPSKQVVWQMPC